jgi:hypothetical protein
MGCKAMIVMPVTTPQLKVDAVRSHGGDVVLFGDSYSDAYLHALELEKQHGLTFVHPFDDPDVIAGQGTIGMEILRQHQAPLDAIFVAVGGGGLLAGVAAYVKAVRPEVKVIGVQTTDSDAMLRSVRAGARVRLGDVGLFSDGTAVKQVGEETFRLVRDLADDFVVVDTDEFPKAGVTADALGKLRPAFSKTGTVTAGNASGINDGAAALLLMGADAAAKRGIKPLARIVSWATAGVDPAIMGSGPIPASRLALQKAGWSVDDLDLIEANEAFAAQACAVNKDLGWDPSKVNVNGGAIALGHPLGATRAMILGTLIDELHRRKLRYGLATLCVGGGMGIATIVERI